MAIQNDFTIYPKSKVIRHTSGTTTYSAVEFYSWLMNTFDEPGYLTYQTPIRFNTPTSFTMLNGWFLDNGDGSNILRYIYGGGIDTTGYATVSDPVYMLDLTSTTDFTSADLGQSVKIADDGVDVGPLLAYLNDYPTSGRARIWVRDTRGTPATIAASSAITTTGTGNGPGAGTVDADATKSGDEIYLNLFTIASFPGSPNPQLYIYQRHPVTGGGYNQRVRIAEWSNLDNFDRGTIDVLFPIKLGGALIDSGTFKTFVRQTGDTFTFVESTVTESGRTPIATETAGDTVNVTKAEYYLMYSSASNPGYTAGTVIQDVATGGSTPPTWYAEIVSHTSLSSSSGYIAIRGLRGVPANTNAIYVGASQLGTAIVSGSVGDTLISWSAGTDPSTLGQIMTGGTSGAKRLLRAVDSTNNKAILQDDPTGVTGASRTAYYKDFANGETVTGATNGSVTLDAASTTLISGYNDVTVAHMNGTIVVDTFSGTFLYGERVTWTGGSAIVIETNGSSSMSLGNVTAETNLNVDNTVITGDKSGATCQVNGTGGMTDDNTEDFAFSLQSANNYAVFIEGGSLYNAGRRLSDIYMYLQFYLRDGQSSSQRVIYTSDGSSITQLAAEEYIKAASAYSATKTAPFGTLAGSTFFGAQGVWIQGMDALDNNSIKLTDHSGTLREPYTSINISITNTRSGDRIAVYLEDGSTTLPDKDTYTSHNTNNVQSDSTFERDTGAMPNDTPTSGTLIVVDTSANEEHRYRYDSRNGTTDPGIFTLPTERSGTATAGSTGQTLIASSATFSTWSIKIGDIIRRTNGAGGWAYITAIDSETQVTTTLLSAGSGWATTETFEINSLVVTYANTDTFFIPYMDNRETTGSDGTPGTETVALTYVSDREVVIEVRNVENATQIVPFKTTGTITSTGLSQSVIRTEDTVYT